LLRVSDGAGSFSAWSFLFFEGAGWQVVFAFVDDLKFFDLFGVEASSIGLIKYELRIVYIRFVGTHAQYNKVNCLEV